jgi:hypothetical protein
MNAPPPIPSIEEFLFNAPLYAQFALARDLSEVTILYNKLSATIDGHCPYCHKLSTFDVHGAHIPSGDPWRDVRERVAFEGLHVECARNEQHKIHFWLFLSKMVLQKIGQFPSLADIANDESKAYRTVLAKEDASEFHKAIGLASHGVGIGSFVYLRRIFERLISRRFEEFKASEGWSEEDFYSRRMSERVEFLRGHLPSFLVENHRIYSILSAGVHELDEAKCLIFFNVLKASIVLILDEDKKKKEELHLRASLKKAIAEFAPDLAPPIVSRGDE